MQIGTLVKIHGVNGTLDNRTIGVVVAITPETAKVDWLGSAPISWSLKKSLEVYDDQEGAYKEITDIESSRRIKMNLSEIQELLNRRIDYEDTKRRIQCSKCKPHKKKMKIMKKEKKIYNE